MKIIISESKTMKLKEHGETNTPIFYDKSQIIKEYLKNMTLKDLQKLWKTNDNLTKLNYDRLHAEEHELTPSLLAYEGLQFQYMNANNFKKDEWEYLDKHLIIISGFYGILKPTDGVTYHRLELQSKISIKDKKNLYEYWREDIESLLKGNIILNLASNEYSKIIKNLPMINCTFSVKENDKIKTKATDAKMLRGMMINFIAKNKIKEVERIKDFRSLSYSFSEELSSENNYIFIKN
ncbi:MAG: peroxide stress protein YaaA [Defluviitaleaceae bacterium]|nr:peroxide stress protein YaaA [Defluviitaleaceae bacterium]